MQGRQHCDCSHFKFHTMKLLPLSLALFLSANVNAETGTSETLATWSKQESGVTSRLRGVTTVNDKIAWASGADNTVLRTDDGGSHWNKISLPTEMLETKLDFRDIDAVDTQTAYLLSIGPGTASRIFKTADSGKHWKLQYTNSDPKGFLDAMTFWDARHGLVIGDSIDGHFQILITDNGGSTWNKIPDSALPPALPNEGAFSASGSNIAVMGRNEAWIGMGGSKSRVLHTADHGKTWTVVDTPLAAGETSGIFSISFRDAMHGVIVGGDYKQENATVDNVAITSDGGKTWELIKEHGLSGFRSAVKYVPGKGKTLIAVGPTGADISEDDGRSWKELAYPSDIKGFDALGFAPGRQAAFASGNLGVVGKLEVTR